MCYFISFFMACLAFLPLAVNNTYAQPTAAVDSVTVEIVRIDTVKVDSVLIESGDVVEVGRKASVSVKVSHRDREVYVLIHPLETDLWYVQNRPVPRKRGPWKTLCYFGQLKKGEGEEFEVLAVAADSPLWKVGASFSTKRLPKGLPQSDIVTVRRVR